MPKQFKLHESAGPPPAQDPTLRTDSDILATLGRKVTVSFEAEVPAGKLVHAIVDNYATHKLRRFACLARQPSALDLLRRGKQCTP
jgi:hypothetical protein